MRCRACGERSREWVEERLVHMLNILETNLSKMIKRKGALTRLKNAKLKVRSASQSAQSSHSPPASFV